MSSSASDSSSLADSFAHSHSHQPLSQECLRLANTPAPLPSGSSSALNFSTTHRSQAGSRSRLHAPEVSLQEQQVRSMKNSHAKTGWNIQASSGAMNTLNPIREIIETMNLAENPNKKVIPLSIGDPSIFGNLKPCKEMLEAINKAHSSGKHFGYQIAAGNESAREAVAEYHSRCTGNNVKKQDVILASGCSHAIDLCICVLAKQGQNILIPRPGFPIYKTLTSVYGVHYKQYDLLADQNWAIDLEHLESLIDDDTAAIVINNPSNPCGSVFSREHLLQVLELAEKYKKPIIADEIYDKFVFPEELYRQHNELKYQRRSSRTTKLINTSAEKQQEGLAKKNNSEFKKPTTIKGYFVGDDVEVTNVTDFDLDETDSCASGELDEEEDYEHDFSGDDDVLGTNNEFCAPFVPFTSISSLSETVPILTCGGISKTCLTPGLRLGWIIINDRQGIFDVSVRSGLNRLTQRLMGPNSLVQGALPDILTKVPDTFYTQTMDFIFRNAKLCYRRLRFVDGLQPHMPQGSMYLMVRFDAQAFPTIDGDLEFTSRLMNEESVLVLPGRCFDFPNYFRICLTVPTNVMEEALDRIREFCERHHADTSSSSPLSPTPTSTPTPSVLEAEPTSAQFISRPLINNVAVQTNIAIK